jgi:FAD-linked oxidoreductase
MPNWTNWGGNQHARPRSVEVPRDVEEVALIVKRAASEGTRVKAVGSGHSFTGAAVTDGALVRLDRLRGLREVNRSSGLVTVQAGTPLHELNPLLAQHGLAMSNLGDIDRQTVAGATSTGTHGTGAKLGGLATQIRGLELVIGDGSVVTCSANERPELFAVARVGLGALGIVTAVTLQCEPAFMLVADERPMPVDEVMQRFDEFAADNDHFEFYWFPHTDRALVKRNNRPPAGDATKPLRRTREYLEDEVFANAAFGAVVRLGRARPALVPRLNRMAANMLSARRFAAPSYEVFISPRRVHFVEMEYAVPREHAAAAFEAIRDVIQREQLVVSFPIEARVVAPDDIALSTASGRDTAYFAIHMYRGVEFERYFRAVEARMRELDGRPHWGKMHYRTAEDLRPVYPSFDEFLAQREAVDPQRVFTNPYLETVLGS